MTALRIHISKPCYIGLLEIGGYEMTLRGEMNVKVLTHTHACSDDAKIAPSARGGDWDPYLTRDSFGPPEPTAQSASRLVRVCRAHDWDVTDRPTDRPRYSVYNNSPSS